MMIAIGVMLATSASIGSINVATNGTAVNVSKASNATLTNATKVVVVVAFFQMSAKQFAAVLRGLAKERSCCQVDW